MTLVISQMCLHFGKAIFSFLIEYAIVEGLASHTQGWFTGIPTP